jgi:hypothetical protein
MAVGARWFTEQQPKHVAIGYQSGSLTERMEHALGDSGWGGAMGAG